MFFVRRKSREARGQARPSRASAALFAAGAGLTAGVLTLAFFSPRFASGFYPGSFEVVAVAAALSLAGFSFVAIVWLARRGTIDKREFAAALALGVVLRALLFFTPPILEDDWRRYLWDGAVIADGIDPYRYPPADGLSPEARTFAASGALADSAPSARLAVLGAQLPDYPERVNHPYLTTIYPPAAQAAFFLANRIAPFNLLAWKAILAAADVATLGLLFALLSAFARSPHWALIYWLNPLVIFETYNAAHMDALLGPFLLLAILWTQRGKAVGAGAALAIAAAVKIWPILASPIFLRRFLVSPAKAALFAAAFALCASLFLAPFALRAGDPASGLAAYASEWKTNSFLFNLLKFFLAEFVSEPDRAARLFSAVAVIGACALLSFRPLIDDRQLAKRALLLCTVIVFASPTGYPWYAIWLFLLWPLAPLRGLAILTACLPLYHLRFIYEAAGGAAPLWISAAQYAPALLILAFYAIKERASGHGRQYRHPSCYTRAE